MIKKLFKSPKFKALWPYYLLALAVILTWHAISRIGFFTGVLQATWAIITPFIYGFVIAYVLNIPNTALKKLFDKTKVPFLVKHKNLLAIISLFLIILLVITLILWIIVPLIVDSLQAFIDNFDTMYDGIINFVNDITEDNPFGIREQVEGLRERIEGIGIDDFASPLASIGNFFASAAGGVFNVILGVIVAIYILASKDKFKGATNRLLKVSASERVYNKTVKYAEILNKNFKRYIYVQTIDGLIMGTAAGIFLALPPFSSPYALLLGIMIGLFNYVPYFGSIVSSAIAILVVVLTEGFWPAGIYTAVGMIILQQLDANVLQPKLLGGSFKLPPLLIIISTVIGGALFGIMGMIIAIPIVAVLRDISVSIMEKAESKKQINANDSGEENPQK